MKILCFGEIMLRLTPPHAQRFGQTQSFDAEYGGSEANVAVSLAQFGLKSAYLTRLPNNGLGRAALGALSQHGVDTAPSMFGGERLGLYFVEMGVGLRGSKVLYDRQDSGMASLAPGMFDWRGALENGAWLHWSGITPALSEGAAAATLEGLKVARELGLRISCDLNYRANLWQYGKTPAEVMPQLVEYSDVLLGDASAFDLYFGLRADEDTVLLEKVAARFPQLRFVAMTRREGRSASHNAYQGLLHDRAQTYTSQKYELPDMLDRIGGGDAFMAGLIFGLRKAQTDAQEAVEFAAAAAALKHYVRGDFNLTSEAEVRALMAGNTGGRVSR
jgi:2-dehydro-3-deoxygluconokinase